MNTQVELMTDYSIPLPDEVREKYNISSLDGSVLNLLPPGGYVGPDESVIQKGDDWICDHWIKRGLFERNSKYHIKFRNNFSQLAHLLIPYEKDEELMRLHYYFLGWTFQHDDVMDNICDHRSSDFKEGFATVAAANKVFCGILNDDYGRYYVDNFPDVDFPYFKPLCHVWRDFHALLHKRIPYYESRNTPFLKYMFEYFNSYILSHGERIDYRYSEESAKYWLRFSTGWKPWIECILLIRGVVTPPLMRKDFYYIRLRTVCEDVIGFINDVFGISKDLLNHETDTLVMFKHLEKGIPLPKAYKETGDFLNEQIRDQKLLLQVLRNRFPNDPHAKGFCRAIEDFIDGYIIWCSTNKRYGGKTIVSHREVHPPETDSKYMPVLPLPPG